MRICCQVAAHCGIVNFYREEPRDERIMATEKKMSKPMPKLRLARK
jgi:hypothetical protein